jgi:hypothetical protein
MSVAQLTTGRRSLRERELGRDGSIPQLRATVHLSNTALKGEGVG